MLGILLKDDELVFSRFDELLNHKPKNEAVENHY